MGLFSALNHIWIDHNTKRCNVVIIGLDGSGKTTIVNHLTGRPDKKVIPTVGISQPRTLRRPFCEMKLFDMGGSASFRKAWKDRLSKAHGAIFVIDSCDKHRMLDAREEFEEYIGTPAFLGKPVAIMMNKQDMGQIDSDQVAELLGLRGNAFTSTPWRIIPCVGAKAFFNDQIDDRLMDTIRWLYEQIETNWQDIKSRVDTATKILELEEKQVRERNKRSVAEKKKKKRNSKNATVVPAQQSAPQTQSRDVKPKPATTILCKNKRIVNNARVECHEPAKHRSAQTGWQPVCDECLLLLTAQQISQESSPKSPARTDPLETIARMEMAGQQGGVNSPSKLEQFVHDRENELISHHKKEKKEKKKHKKSKKHKNKDLQDQDQLSEYAFVRYRIDDRVEGNFKGKGKWYGGKVTWVNENGTVSIQYDDGDSEDNKGQMEVCPADGPILSAGTRVEVRYKGGVNFFRGKIIEVQNDGITYAVAFDDGEKDNAVSRSWIRVLLR